MFEYTLGINSEGREMFLPVKTDITQSYQYKLGKDEWIPILLGMKQKYKLTQVQLERTNTYLALIRAHDTKHDRIRHDDYYKQITVEFIKENFVNA